ncbi:MAG: CvpA family protein [Firmicutes bacterium]|nr:CvpA family protein [Bacillota bacterium]
MNVLDWIIIVAAGLGLVLGLLKGFLKPLFSAIGFFVVVVGIGLFSPTVQQWFVNVEMSDNVRSLVAILATGVILFLVYLVLSLILRKLITRKSSINVLNRIIGGVLGVIIVYMAFSVIIAWVASPFGGIGSLNEKFGAEFEQSWICSHIYKNNFFGDWIINDLLQKLFDTLSPAALL